MRTNLTITLLLTVLTVLAALAARADDASRTYEHVMADAIAAFRAEDWPAVAAHLDEAQELRPHCLHLLKNRILAYHLSGRTEEALALAESVARKGLALEMSGHDGLVALARDPRFVPIEVTMIANASAVIGEATVQWEITRDDLLPEAIAPTEHGAYVGSARTGKILHVGPAGALREVATARGGVFDLEVRGGFLHAVVNDAAPFEGARADSSFAAIQTFEIATGRLVRDVRVDGATALLGDLEIDVDGTAYASDSRTPRVFRLRADQDVLEELATDPRFGNLQGIALDRARNCLFVADYLSGLFSVALHDGSVRPLANPTTAFLGGIDGLVLHRGHLVGVQNGTKPQRIVHILLDPEGTRVDDLRVVQQNHPLWHEPTHGAMVGDAFHYVATSNWPAYDDAGALRDGAALHPVRILALTLPGS